MEGYSKRDLAIKNLILGAGESPAANVTLSTSPIPSPVSLCYHYISVIRHYPQSRCARTNGFFVPVIDTQNDERWKRARIVETSQLGALRCIFSLPPSPIPHRLPVMVNLEEVLENPFVARTRCSGY